MRRQLEAYALIPTFVVALISLASGVSLYGFAKRVVATYLFFWVLGMAFEMLVGVVLKRAASVQAGNAVAAEPEPEPEPDAERGAPAAR